MLYANYTYNLITQASTIDVFQQNMLGIPEKNDWGVHMSGHYTIGGDPGGVSKFFSSPSLVKEMYHVRLGDMEY